MKWDSDSDETDEEDLKVVSCSAARSEASRVPHCTPSAYAPVPYRSRVEFDTKEAARSALHAIARASIIR